MQELAAKYHGELLDHVAEQDDRLLEKIPGRRGTDRAEIKTCIRKSTIANTMVPVVCGLPTATRACRSCSTPSSTTCPPRPAIPRHPRRQSRPRRRWYVIRPTTGPSPRWPWVPPSLRRQAVLLPRLLGHGQRRLHRIQFHQGQQRAHRPHPPDARQPSSGYRNRLCGRHRRRGGPEKRHHRRHPLPEKDPVILESMEFPDPVIRVAIEPKTKAGQERWASPWRNSPRRTHLQGVHR